MVLNGISAGGDIVAQERVLIEPGDSFVTLGWKGTKRLAHLQAQAILPAERGESFVRRPVMIPADPDFDNPTLGEYLRYRRRHRLVR